MPISNFIVLLASSAIAAIAVSAFNSNEMNDCLVS